jgi:hypothetical protein
MLPPEAELLMGSGQDWVRKQGRRLIEGVLTRANKISGGEQQRRWMSRRGFYRFSVCPSAIECQWGVQPSAGAIAHDAATAIPAASCRHDR